MLNSCINMELSINLFGIDFIYNKETWEDLDVICEDNILKKAINCGCSGLDINSQRNSMNTTLIKISISREIRPLK